MNTENSSEGTITPENGPAQQEIKHTPGPWFRIHDHPDPRTQRSLAAIAPEGGGFLNAIAHIYQCDDVPEQAANANLIAAAPELLEAVEGLPLTMAKDIRGTTRYVMEVEASTLTALLAAIAKARGK
jgi:hypothetical protein